MFKYFFAKSGTVAPYHIFSSTHFIMVGICAMLIAFALWHNRHADHKKVLQITRWCAVLLWTLEIIKIVYQLMIGNGNNPNTFVPLYFCSIPLYCSLMSGWGRGWVKRTGDVFLIVGGMVGGVAYLISPSTTAGIHQAFHFITIQSYILHGIMVFLSVLYVITGYYKLVMSDIKFYALTVVIVCVIARIVNYLLVSNLMFVSYNFPGTPIELLYNWSPKYFPFWMTFIQAVPPFFVVYALVFLLKKMVRSIRVAQSPKESKDDCCGLVR